MCQKCVALKKIWYEKHLLALDMLSERTKADRKKAYYIIRYERKSAWDAYFNQARKHTRRNI